MVPMILGFQCFPTLKIKFVNFGGVNSGCVLCAPREKTGFKTYLVYKKENIQKIIAV